MPSLTIRWAMLIVATTMAGLFVYWAVQVVRSEEIRVAIRGSTLLFRRRQGPVFYYVFLAVHLLGTALAVALVAMVAITA